MNAPDKYIHIVPKGRDRLLPGYRRTLVQPNGKEIILEQAPKDKTYEEKT